MLSREAKGSKAKRISKGNQPKTGAGAGPGILLFKSSDKTIVISPSELRVLVFQTSPWNGTGFGGESVRTHALTPKSGYLSREFPESPGFLVGTRWRLLHFIKHIWLVYIYTEGCIGKKRQ